MRSRSNKWSACASFLTCVYVCFFSLSLVLSHSHTMSFLFSRPAAPPDTVSTTRTNGRPVGVVPRGGAPTRSRSGNSARAVGTDGAAARRRRSVQCSTPVTIVCRSVIVRFFFFFAVRIDPFCSCLHRIRGTSTLYIPRELYRKHNFHFFFFSRSSFSAVRVT